MGALITITDSNWRSVLPHFMGRGTGARGLIPRDRSAYPEGYLSRFAKPFDLPLIDEGEYAERIADQEKYGSSLQHIRDTANGGQPIPCLNQNGQGYCWAYSSTGTMEMIRARMGEPYIALSGHMVGCIVKGYRDEGGWGSESIEFIAENGVASQALWPQDSMSRSNDTPAMRADAKLRVYLQWMECSSDAATRWRQVCTALLMSLPVVTDYNWWSHSVHAIRLMSATKLRIRNSWGDEWSQNGVGDLDDSRARPDDAWVPYLATAS